MNYRVEELAAAAGVKVDTVRFYQSKGLLPAPRRVKRVAEYSGQHLDRLRQIRRYQERGLSLAVIKRVLDGKQPVAAARGSKAETLRTLVSKERGERSLTRAQLSEQTGVPEALIAAVETAGLLQPSTVATKARYGDADVQILRAGLEIMRHGFPLDELLRLATSHAKGVEKVCASAVDLFDRYVRKAGEAGVSSEEVAETFRRLLPAVTTLVALHFQRTLLSRALARLSAHGDAGAIDAAQAALESGHLEVAWR